jgi:hypothetical protein
MEQRAFEELRTTLGLTDADLYVVLAVADVRLRRYGRRINALEQGIRDNSE